MTMTIGDFIVKFGRLFPAFVRHYEGLLESKSRGLSYETLREDAIELAGYLLCVMDMDYLEPDDYLSLTKELYATARGQVIESAPEQVSTPAAPGSVRVRGVLVPTSPSGVAEKPRLVINLLFDELGGITLDRSAFPRLGKHWAPAHLVSGTGREGHPIYRH